MFFLWTLEMSWATVESHEILLDWFSIMASKNYQFLYKSISIQMGPGIGQLKLKQKLMWWWSSDSSNSVGRVSSMLRRIQGQETRDLNLPHLDWGLISRFEKQCSRVYCWVCAQRCLKELYVVLRILSLLQRHTLY